MLPYSLIFILCFKKREEKNDIISSLPILFLKLKGKDGLRLKKNQS